MRKRATTTGTADAVRTLRRRDPIVCGVLEDALTRGGCAICQAIRTVDERAMFAFLYEGMASPAGMDAFVAGGGLCPHHWHLAIAMSRGRGHVGPSEIATLVAFLLPKVIADVEGLFARGKQRRHFAVWRHRVTRVAPALVGCLICQENRPKEAQLLGMLEQLIETEPWESALRTRGLCYGHVLLALELWKDDSARQLLVEIARHYVSELIGDAKEFVRKQDERYRRQPFGRERDVVRRATEFILGTRLNFDFGGER